MDSQTRLRLLAPQEPEAKLAVRHVTPPKPEPFSEATASRLLALSIETLHVEPSSGKFLLSCLIVCGLILVLCGVIL